MAPRVYGIVKIPKTQHALIRSTCRHAFTQSNNRSVEVRNIVGSVGFRNRMRRATSRARLGMVSFRGSCVSCVVGRFGLGLRLRRPSRRGCMVFGCGVLRRGRRRGRIMMRPILTEPPIDADNTFSRIIKVPEETLAQVDTAVSRTSFASVGDLSLGSFTIVFDSDLLEALGSRIVVSEHWKVKRHDKVIWVVPDPASSKSSLVPCSSSVCEALPTFDKREIVLFALGGILLREVGMPSEGGQKERGEEGDIE